MKLNLLFATALLWSVAQAVAVPEVDGVNSQAEQLWKRKGGGGGGGKGGGGSSSGGSSSGGSSSGSSSGASSGGSRGGSLGGSTRSGSGAPRSFGGGGFYGGGARVPYKSGSPSPRGIVPIFFVAGALAFWPGVWLYGAHMYPYSHPYGYYNRTAAANQTRNVLCGCDPYTPCGCDDDNNTQLIQDLVGDGVNYNRSLLQLATVNGTATLLINGSLPNGTTAPGGEDDFDNAGNGMRGLVEAFGYWPMVATACAAVFLA